MVMADVFAVVFTMLGLFVALPAYWLMGRSLWPNLSTQAERRFRQTPGRATVMGAFSGGLALLPVAGLANVPGVNLGALLLFAALLGFALAGAGGLAARIGADLAAPSDTERPWLVTVRGGVVLEFACLVPIVGWFLITPWVLMAGMGAATLAWLRPLSAAASRDAEAALAA